MSEDMVTIPKAALDAILQGAWSRAIAVRNDSVTQPPARTRRADQVPPQLDAEQAQMILAACEEAEGAILAAAKEAAAAQEAAEPDPLMDQVLEAIDAVGAEISELEEEKRQWAR
jgi:hypothetical protein